MNAETMYTLGQLARSAFPDGAPPDLIITLLAKPASGVASIMKDSTANTSDEDFERLMGRLPADLSDPKGGVKASDQGPFWLGYYQWSGARDQALNRGPDELEEAGQALYGDRWQTDLKRALGISDTRRIRQWMSEDRPIPTGVWADISLLLRSRAFHALVVADKLDSPLNKVVSSGASAS